MASYVGAITDFNPYIQQIPTEAYTKVGMFKEQQYEAGIAKIQDSVDKIAGLDIANEGGRQYLRARVDELTKSLNKYAYVDFSNPNNVSQLTSLAKPLYQDENIVNDVINTGIYRKWSKDAADAYKNGKMELGQYMRETTDVNVWLNSPMAGAQYTGRQTPNTATKKDLVDRIIKAKKDGLEKSEYVYDKSYSIDTPYYVKSTNKRYSEADFNNFVANNLMSTRDREMLMNDHWYENQGKSTQQLQLEDVALYQSKVDANNAQIQYYKSFGDANNANNVWAGDRKIEYQQKIRDLENYNKTLTDGKISYLKGLDPNDPNTRDVYHRDLAESRFISSLDILRDEVRKEEYQKNEQWFLEKKAELDLATEMAKNATRAAATTKKKTGSITDIEDEVALFTPVDPTAPKTEISLNTIRTGYQRRNDEVISTMNNLIGKLQQNGVDMNQFIAGWDQVQVGSKGGASMNVPRFKSPADKEKFYNMAMGLNYAYNIEASDGNIDNKSFRDFIKAEMGYDDEENSNTSFKSSDKIINDALQSIKGTSALLPKLEGLFADKGVVRTLAQMDAAIRDKKNFANDYREALYKSNALTTQEMKTLRELTDEQLLNNSYYLDTDVERRRYANQGLKPVHSIIKDDDGTYSVVQNIVSDPNNTVPEDLTIYNVPESMLNTIRRNTSVEGTNVLARGYKSYDEANKAFQDGNLQMNQGISKESMKKAEDFVKKTYSYVQENLNSTVQNLKNDKDAYAAVQDGLTLFLNRARRQAGTSDISIEGGTIDPNSLTGITKVEVLGASINNTEDVFNPNPVYEVTFSATTGQGTKEEKTSTYNGTVSLKSFLATNPNYKTSDYAKYFAPAIYAEKDAAARIHATVNPLEGSEGSYYNRSDIEPVYQVNTGSRTFFSVDMEDYAWETLPIERDGKQTMVSYQVVSLGQNTVLGNAKNKDGQQYAPGAFYIKMKVPTTNGSPKEIFLKRPSGDSYAFNSASNAHYTIRDLIFNNPELKMDETDPKTGKVNYFSVDPTTIRGIFNAQLSYNGFSKLETTKMKDALGVEIQKQQAKELQFGSR